MHGHAHYTVLTKVHAVRLYLYASSASGSTREDTVGCTREDTVGCTREDTVGCTREDTVGCTREDTVGEAELDGGSSF